MDDPQLHLPPFLSPFLYWVDSPYCLKVLSDEPLCRHAARQELCSHCVHLRPPGLVCYNWYSGCNDETLSKTIPEPSLWRSRHDCFGLARSDLDHRFFCGRAENSSDGYSACGCP